MKMKRLTMLALVTGGITLLAPITARAIIAGGPSFSYWRNNSLDNGSIQYRCMNGTCGSPIWRAGSGNPNAPGGGMQQCQLNNWIPVGMYDVAWHDHHYDGTLIKGRVWRLSNYQCNNGVTRTELFVHTEETVDNSQSCPTGGDDPFCWEGPNDYFSNGCIKVARRPVGTDGYSDVGRLDNWTHTYGSIAWLQVYATF